MPKVSVVIATYNMAPLILETIASIRAQEYKDFEIIVYDDVSTDGTDKITWPAKVRYIRGKENVGVGNAFNAGIAAAAGEYVVLMCADDLFTSKKVLSDIVSVFEENPKVGYIFRWYYQFVENVWTPVRAWRTHDPLVQANNPSGLAFRAAALKGAKCSNRMFIETSALAAQVLKEWLAYLLPWDTVAVRVHASTSTQPGYFAKRRVSSPVTDWVAIGATDILKDYVSFIQIKNGHTMKAVWEEVVNFARYRPLNLVHPGYYFYAFIALVTPRRILRGIPRFYRKYIGPSFVRIVKRPTNKGE